ncbi:hypothetical protein CHS0354_026854 [Potamilus streckersoni]|uniref:Uncharacterized protein n=1 Tax=Potamilus streckersoni TaxID=2493646 RepID=A0AAE0VZK7_9BIVA|nr:hypothetical protein CHS0354_026854 [Potamilus streckersoni]
MVAMQKMDDNANKVTLLKLNQPTDEINEPKAEKCIITVRDVVGTKTALMIFSSATMERYKKRSLMINKKFLDLIKRTSTWRRYMACPE